MKKPENMSETYFRKNVIDPWLKKYSKYWIATTGIACRNGIPDYICHVNDIVIYIEAKKVSGSLTAYEANEIVRLRKAELHVFVVNPLNWNERAQSILDLAYPGLKGTDRRYIDDDEYYTIFSFEGSC